MAEVLTVGLPTLAVLIGILVNNSRLSDLRGYIDARWDAERRVADERSHRLEDRMERLGVRVESLEKALFGKVEDVDNRLSRLEERFRR